MCCAGLPPIPPTPAGNIQNRLGKCVCVCVSGRLCDAVGAAQCSATKQSSDARVAFLLFPFSPPFGPRVPSTMSTRRPPLFSLACPSPLHPTTLLLYNFKSLNGVGRESFDFIYVFPSKLVRASPEGSPEESGRVRKVTILYRFFHQRWYGRVRKAVQKKGFALQSRI